MRAIHRVSIALRIAFFVIPMAIVSIIRTVLRARSRGLDIKVAIRNGIVKSFMANLLPQQLQSLLPSGYTVFERWIAEKQVSMKEKPESSTDILQDGVSKLFWVGCRGLGSNVVLFLHGGGYVLPLSKGHLEWADYFRRVGALAGQQICVALLDYSLCPEATYPKQMQQAVLALERLVSLGYSPSQIVIGGDSAGGHLSLSLLSHLMHQYPDDKFPALRLSTPLSGCFLVSPLLSLDLDTPSYRENQHADLLSIPVIQDWGEDLFKGSQFVNEKQNGKGWGMALSSDKVWWSRLGEIVKRVYLVSGGEELFRDHIIEFGERLKVADGVDVSVHINMEEAHDGTFMDFEIGASPSRSTVRLGDWVVESLELSNQESS
ncbi:uncharacterized protein PAC_17991 [Phialocephala subalpina]|uniref:Alpha/beta hydrolase fold-3 domain-containing protein n=1 Tax=Phialocephala subalpina TaxID=576137 RepID=A0A1L7XSS1_9HELO|nr:uncharacterized protein PAC_17991 [Phialocephala subalpina]